MKISRKRPCCSRRVWVSDSKRNEGTSKVSFLNLGNPVVSSAFGPCGPCVLVVARVTG